MDIRRPNILFLAISGLLTPVAAQSDSYERFLPATAVLEQQLHVDFRNTGVEDTVLVYTLPDARDNAYHSAGIQILKKDASAGWVVEFQDVEPGMMPHDSLAVAKLRAANGREGLLVTSQYSGAGAATRWHVLAYVSHKITKLDPTRERIKVLKGRGYKDFGSTSVRADGDLLTEHDAGYSKDAAHCCPDRPTLQVIFRFTGDSIKLVSSSEEKQRSRR